MGSRPAPALTLHLPESAVQGDIVVGRVIPEAPLFVDGRRAAVGEDGYFAVGIGQFQNRDLMVSARDGNTQVRQAVRVLARRWDVQRVDGLARWHVHPDPDQLRRIESDNRRIAAVRERTPSPHTWFLERGFVMPVDDRLSGVFGSRRILNGEPRSPHRGIDIAAPKGTKVVSPADGIVRLTAPGLFLMGNAMVIDHGLGIQSTFIHLDRILVREGDRVLKGETVARVGRTGRATGPHLHWSVSVASTLVDPQRLIGRRFEIP